MSSLIFSEKKKIQKTTRIGPQCTDAPPRFLALPRGMTLGQRYHTLKGLDVGKCHTKFQLSSLEGIKVISCKRNADINLHLSLQVNLNMVMNVTYAHMHVGAYGRNITAKRYMPHSSQRQAGA